MCLYEGRIKKFLRWFLKKENASMTVEASYIVPMTVVCIVVMCFLMIYAYNQVALSADSYYLARKLANVEVEKVPYNFQEEGENFYRRYKEAGSYDIKGRFFTIEKTGFGSLIFRFDKERFGHAPGMFPGKKAIRCRRAWQQ